MRGRIRSAILQFVLGTAIAAGIYAWLVFGLAIPTL